MYIFYARDLLPRLKVITEKNASNLQIKESQVEMNPVLNRVRPINKENKIGKDI